MNKKYLWLAFLFILFCFSCSDNKCSFGIKSPEPAGSALSVDMGSVVRFSAEAETCGAEGSIKYLWSLNSREVSRLNEYTFFACASVLGKNTVEVVITDPEGNTATRSWSITVNALETPPRPQCVTDSIYLVQQGGRFGDFAPYFDPAKTAQNVSEFSSARDCLDSYLADYVCDVEANYADALAKITLELNSIDSMLADRAQRFSRGEVLDLLENRIQSIIDNLSLVMQEGPFVDFSSSGFYIPNKLEIGVFEGTPGTPEDDIWLNFSGRHDLTEASFFLTFSRLMKAQMEIILSFNGIPEFAARIPDEPDFEEVVGMLIDSLEADSGFLQLSGAGGSEGKERLLRAQAYLTEGIRGINTSINMITAETGDQTLSLLRYWDCGKDGVCPGDPDERQERTKPCGETSFQDKNLNGECNRAHCSTPEADPNDCEAPDEGEANYQFDSGEPLGTEMVAYYDEGSITYRRISFPAGSVINNAIELIAGNIEGPEALDFDDLIGLPSGTVETFLNAFGIPVPEVRLSEFFVTPTGLRELLPLYSRQDRFFIYQTEVENFFDVGYDGCSDSMEDGSGCTGNPNSLPDPNHDNFNINTNCEDGFDNDSDGNIDEYNTSGLCADLGPEGDLKFNFLDTNRNGRFDPGEKAEPFNDIGIEDGSGTVVGAGNGTLDQIDVEHYWPSGEDVGGNHPGIENDPRDTIAQDQSDPDGRDFCIDPYYFFLPDPTFSSVLTFPQQLVNIDGIELNRNAKFHRFVSKSIETAEEMGFIE